MLIIYIQIENEKIVSKFVGIIKCCDPSGDRVSKNNKRLLYL